MSTARKILSNTFIQVTGKIFTAIMSVVTVKLITNFLSVDGYGQYVSVYEFLAFFGIMADLGLFTIAVREMSKEDDQKKRDFILGNVLSIRMLLATVAMLLAIVVVFLVPNYQGTYIPIGVSIASLSVFLSILYGTISSVLQVELKMEYPTIALIMGRVVTVGLMIYIILVAFAGDPSAGAFYRLLGAGALGNLVMFIITCFFAARYAKLSFRFDFEYWRSTIWSALPYGLALVLNMVYFRIDSILLLLLRGAEDVGLYGVPLKIMDILSIIPIYFMNSVLPSLTRHLKHNVERAKFILQSSFDFLVAMALPIVVGAQVLAYPLIFVISSEDYLSRINEGFYGSDIALRLLVFAMCFAFLSAVFTFALIAIGYQGKLLYISAAGALFNVIANILVIPEWGFRGAAFTSILSEMIIVVCAYLMFRRYFSMRFRFGDTLKIVVSSLVMGSVVYVLRDPLYGVMENFNFVVLVPLGAVVYLAMLFVTGVVSKERLDILRGR